MFTGIVAELGEVAGIEHSGDAARLTIRGSVEGVVLGESIAVNGVCLTVTEIMDGTGTIISRTPAEHWDQVRISLPASLSRYVVHKGSIAVDGISLTVSALGPPGGETWFEVCLIPETLKRTTMGARQPGEVVNLEVDVIAKYVERLLSGEANQ